MYIAHSNKDTPPNLMVQTKLARHSQRVPIFFLKSYYAYTGRSSLEPHTPFRSATSLQTQLKLNHFKLRVDISLVQV